MYTYIQSRFYRAPEVILGATFGMPIDMWSLGCILAELLTGYPLLPGEDEADQLSCIIELLGIPPKKIIESAARSHCFFSSKGHPRYCEAKTISSGATISIGGVSRRGKFRGPPGSKTFEEALKGCEDPLFLDFIKKCLQWDPQRRLTPSKALRHAWLRRRLPRPPDQEDKPEATSSCPPGCAMNSGGTVLQSDCTTASSSVSRSSSWFLPSCIPVSSSAMASNLGDSASSAVTVASCRMSLSSSSSSRHSQQQTASSASAPAPPPLPPSQTSGSGGTNTSRHENGANQPSSLPSTMNHQLNVNSTGANALTHNNSLQSHNGGSHGSLNDSHSRSSHGSSGVSNRFTLN